MIHATKASSFSPISSNGHEECSYSATHARVGCTWPLQMELHLLQLSHWQKFSST